MLGNRGTGRCAARSLSRCRLCLPDDEFIRIEAPERTLALSSLILQATNWQRALGRPPALWRVCRQRGGVEYWSDDVVNSQLAGRGRRVLERMAQAQIFTDAGVDEDFLTCQREHVCLFVNEARRPQTRQGKLRFLTGPRFSSLSGFHFSCGF